jgi:hypothetical protein
MIQPTRDAVQLDRHRNTYRNTCGKAEEGAEAEAITDPEDNRVRYDPRKQSQWAMLSTQEVVCKVKAAHDVKTAARDADRRNCMMVHSGIVSESLSFLAQRCGRDYFVDAASVGVSAGTGPCE